MIDLLRKYTSSFLSRLGNVALQVKSVLSKLTLCRTEALLGRLYECPNCHQRCGVYNSCGDRHCPQCSGARRADWLDRSSQLVLANIDYFQVVFTIPDRLSRLVLGNRRELYRLLFRSAWQAIKHELEAQQIDPAALLVLHTWNQELHHHPHIHALVPGTGPSRNQDNDPCWVTARDATRPWRNKPSLVDNVTLGRTFRDKFVRGLGWLIRNQRLKLTEEWQILQDPKVLRPWLKSLRETDWNVFIEGPPDGQSDPQDVLKYLTRYVTGGPISDQRIESDENGIVTFLARSKSKGNSKNKQPRRINVPGAEFVRRWSLHILPKGFVRCRAYGGYHGSRRKAYLEICRQLLPPSQPTTDEPATDSIPPAEIAQLPASPLCPRCQIEMECIAFAPRPSWREIFGEQRARTLSRAWNQAEPLCAIPTSHNGSRLEHRSLASIPKPDD